MEWVIYDTVAAISKSIGLLKILQLLQHCTHAEFATIAQTDLLTEVNTWN